VRTIETNNRVAHDEYWFGEWDQARQSPHLPLLYHDTNFTCTAMHKVTAFSIVCEFAPFYYKTNKTTAWFHESLSLLVVV
jgi:hypothetical protein